MYLTLPGAPGIVRTNPLKGHITWVQWQGEYPEIQFRLRGVYEQSGEQLWESEWARTGVIAPYRGPAYATINIPAPPTGVDLRQVQVRLVALAFASIPGSSEALYRGCVVAVFWIDPRWRPHSAPLAEHIDHGWERVIPRGSFAPYSREECLGRWQGRGPGRLGFGRR